MLALCMDHTHSQSNSGLTDSTMLKSHLALSGRVLSTMKMDLPLFLVFILSLKMYNNVIWTYYMRKNVVIRVNVILLN